MDNPGISLFNGVVDLNVDPSNQHDEEEEALEEEKRRNEELQDIITNAFDDLSEFDDDDESAGDGDEGHTTAGTTPNFDSMNHGDHSQSEEHHIQDHSAGASETSKNGEHLTNYEQSSEIFPNGAFRNLAGGDASHFMPQDVRYNAHYDPTIAMNYNGEQFAVDNSEVSCQHYLQGWRLSPYALQQAHVLQQTHESMENAKNISSGDLQGEEQKYLAADYNSVEQLKTLYDVRLREIDHLHSELQKTRETANDEIRSLHHQVAVLKAEKTGAQLTRNEAQTLLANSKEKIGELEREIKSLKETNFKLEEAKSKLKEELDISKVTITDLQQQIVMIEKGTTIRDLKKDHDTKMRSLQERCQREIIALEEKFGSTELKLKHKEEQCKSLENQLKEAMKNRDTVLVEKTETINKLAQSLSESQKQCQELMSSELSKENISLKVQLNALHNEKISLEETYKSLQKQYESVHTDLSHYETAMKLGIVNLEGDTDSDSLIQLGLSKRKAVSKHPTNDLNSKLREELTRSLVGQRMKREEINKLTKRLETREKEILHMKEQEKKYVVEVERFKADTEKLLAQLKKEKLSFQGSNNNNLNELLKFQNLRSTLEEQLASQKRESDRLLEENDHFKKKNEELQKQLDEVLERSKKEQAETSEAYSSQFLTFHNEAVAKIRAEKNEELEMKIKDLSFRLERALKDCDEVKQAYIDLSNEKQHVEEVLQAMKAQLQQCDQKLEEEKAKFKVFKQEKELLLRKMSDAWEKEKAKFLEEQQKMVQEFSSSNATEEISRARAQITKEMELECKKKCERMQKELEQDYAEKLKADMQVGIAEAKLEWLKEHSGCCTFSQEENEKINQLQTEGKKLKLELQILVQNHQKEMEMMKIRSEEAIKMVLRSQQKDLEQKLREEYQEEIKKIEEEREKLMKEMRQQVEAEKAAFVERYDRDIQSIVDKRRRLPSKCIATSPVRHREQGINTVNMFEEGEQQVKVLKEKIQQLEKNFQKQEEDFHSQLIHAETEYTNNLSALKAIMESKAVEIEKLKTAMAEEQEKLKANVEMERDASNSEHVAAVKQLEEKVRQLTDDLRAKEQQIVKEKEAMDNALKVWTEEVQKLKEKLSSETEKYEKMETKKQALKQKVLAYKKYIVEKESHYRGEYKRIEDGFKDSLLKVKEKMDNVCTKRNEELERKVVEIEKMYEKKIEKLKKKSSAGSTGT